MLTYDWQEEYKRLNTGFRQREARPVIAITGNYDRELCSLAEGYYRSVLQTGGIPMIIPPFEQTSNLGELLDRVDGLILSGGGDPNPLLFGEQPVRELHSITPMRDVQELLLVRLAADRQIPMLGICKGIQMINAALGGTLYQDINTQMEGVRLKHSQDLDRGYASHTVSLTEGSDLAKIFHAPTLEVNSFHHQAVKDVAPGFRVSAVSEDGVIEAIESSEYKSIIGVQWHPECFCLRREESFPPTPYQDRVDIDSPLGKTSNQMIRLFKWLVGEAASFKKAKSLHDCIVSLDSHCDTPMFFHQNIDFSSRDPRILVDLHKMHEGHLDASIMVAYLQQKERDPESLKAATAKANRILTQIEEMVERNCTAVEIAYKPEDVALLKRMGKKSIMLGVENGYAIGKDIANVEAFRKRGVVYMTLCHNGDNDICDSAKGQGEHGGVSPFGAEVIKEMNRVGMMVDLSHGAETSFYDALEISALPIVCSHSSSRLLCDHPRNLTDDQLRSLARKGGVAQVTFYNGFLRQDGQATVIDAIEHLNHMVSVMGVEHVGIGTDFDGDGGVPGCASASELVNFTRLLLRERYSEDDIRLIWGGNFFRVMNLCQSRSEVAVCGVRNKLKGGEDAADSERKD